jgi:colicin import membrane protein
MSRVVIGSAAYKITADTSGLTDGVKITRREIGQANRILEQTKPAAQKLEESMALLEKAFNAGTISAEKYNQALATLHQQKNMLAANTSQVAQALKKLPLPDVAKQAIDAAANVKQLGEAFKTLMASPQVLGMIAAVTALTVAYKVLTDQIDKARQAREKLEDEKRSAAEAAARTATSGLQQELELIQLITGEARRRQAAEQLLQDVQTARAKANEEAETKEQRRREVLQEMLAAIEQQDKKRAAALQEQANNLKDQRDAARATVDELKKQEAVLAEMAKKEDEQAAKRRKDIERTNQYEQDMLKLREEILRTNAEIVGLDYERQKMLEGLNWQQQRDMELAFEAVDAIKQELEEKRKAEKEREAAAKKQIDDIKEAIREQEKLTEEMQKQAEAIRDVQDPSRVLRRRLSDLEQMGLQGMLSPEEVAAAIAEAVGQHLEAMERDKQSVQMIDRNTMAHIQFEQKMQTEAEKREKKSLQIQEKQAEILGNIERTNQATADALAALDLV